MTAVTRAYLARRRPGREPVTPAELADVYRRAPLWHQAVSDAQALVVADMRVTTPAAEIAEMLELSDKRIYQLLGEATAVQADPQRLRRAGAIAELARTGVTHGRT